jgi:alginate O-acetyltransferase complex protein AlgI
LLFHSPQFLVFFAGYFLAHRLTPLRYRLVVILMGGTIFYGYWNPALVWLPYLLALIGWAGSMWIAASARAPQRRLRVIASLVLLFAPLVLFKYANFIYRELVQPTLGLSDWSSGLSLPLGISFVTFTMAAYLVDGYRRVYPLDRRAHMAAAYMVFFPHLIAGPILRPHELIPQLNRPRAALGASFKLGVLLFTIGLAKKVIFANQLAEVVDRVYAGGAGLSGYDYLLAIYGFSLQIYCDFSGYTDMAIGLALVLGVRLPNNFNRPYGAASIAEFWRRWHITLSLWLRDYLYIPLGGNRKGRLDRARNVMITMALGGLWHGANWTFVLWGVLHGLGIVLGHLTRRAVESGPAHGLVRALKVAITFHVVTLLWILFRAPDMTVARRVLLGPLVQPLGDSSRFVGANLYPLALLGVFLLWHRFDTHARLRLAARNTHPAILWPAAALVWALAVGVGTGSSAKFIYFDF